MKIYTLSGDWLLPMLVTLEPNGKIGKDEFKEFKGKLFSPFELSWPSFSSSGDKEQGLPGSCDPQRLEF